MTQGIKINLLAGQITRIEPIAGSTVTVILMRRTCAQTTPKMCRQFLMFSFELWCSKTLFMD